MRQCLSLSCRTGPGSQMLDKAVIYTLFYYLSCPGEVKNLVLECKGERAAALCNTSEL